MIEKQIHSDLTDLFDKGVIEPAVSRVVEFADLPAAMEAREARQTTGRVVVRVQA
jgi:NADPH:quinone reductase-like Zn-dependent oxidoreductase